MEEIIQHQDQIRDINKMHVGIVLPQIIHCIIVLNLEIKEKLIQIVTCFL